MFSALSWLPRGAAKAKLPEGVVEEGVDEGDQMDVITADNPQESPKAVNGDMEKGSNTDDSDEEVDIGQILASELDTLSFHKRNEKDPYLASDPKANELFDEEELEDLIIRPTDALIVAAKTGNDVSTLEVHLFDDDPDASDEEDGPYEPHVYVHHDVVLPVFPLCTAYTRLSIENEDVNLVAVGMFTPGIDIWDIDRVNNLEPVVSLGGYQERAKVSSAMAAAARRHNRTKRKKKAKLRLKEGSHESAVMCLSWNNVQREYLASGSEDSTVKVWDIESEHCACTLDHHSDKVQSVAFHPSNAEKLISGSFDKTVSLIDLRDPGKKQTWSITADVEVCQWGSGPSTENIFVTTEDGYMTVIDPRKSYQANANNFLAKWRAHKGAATAFSISADIPGLMVSGGVDKQVKVWDISSIGSGRAGELIYERKSKAGSLFALSLSPIPEKESNASPFVVAFAGAQGTLGVSDLAVESKAVRNRFLKHCSTSSSVAIERRAARQKEPESSAPPEMASEESDENEDKNGNNDGWESE